MSEAIRPIDLLTRKEKLDLCDSLSNMIMLHILDNRNKYRTTVLAGQRTQDIDEEKAAELFKQHLDVVTVNHYLNTMLENFIHIFKHNVKKYIAQGFSKFDAVAKALSAAIFFNENKEILYKIEPEYLQKYGIDTSDKKLINMLSSKADEFYAAYYEDDIELKLQLDNEALMAEAAEKMAKISELEKQIAESEKSQEHLIEKSDALAQEKALNKELTAQKDAAENKITELTNQVESLKAALVAIEKQLEKKYAALEKEKDQALAKAVNVDSAEVKALRQQVIELTNLNGVLEIDDDSYLSKFDDTVAMEHLKAQRLSMCVVAGQGLDTHLIRIADVKGNGLLLPYQKQVSEDGGAQSIDKIRLSDATKSMGSIGIWSWGISKKAASNNKRGIDSTVSRQQSMLEPTEVVILPDVFTLDALLERVKAGIECLSISKKVLFTARKKDASYVGVLCNATNSSFNNGKFELKEQCNEIAVYEFGSDSILSGLILGHSLFNRIFLGKPDYICPLKSPFEIVKDIVWFSMSWRGLVDRELAVQSIDDVADLIKNLPHSSDVIHKIMQSCHCSHEKAQSYLDKFLAEAHNYVSYNTIEDKVILSALKAHGELQDKAKDLLRDEWEQSNQALIQQLKTKEAKLDELERERIEANNKLDTLSSRINDAHAELEKLDSAIDQKRELIANDATLTAKIISELQNEQSDKLSELQVQYEQEIAKLRDDKEEQVKAIEEAVATRIAKAKENVSSFVSEMLFFNAAHPTLFAQQTSAAVAQPYSTAVHAPAPAPAPAPDATSAATAAALPADAVVMPQAAAVAQGAAGGGADVYRMVSCRDKIKGYQERDALGGILRILKSNLKRAGVNDNYALALAKFLLAAFIHKQPLIVVGPNSRDIIDAFAAVICQGDYGQITCLDTYHMGINARFGSSGERMVVINNLISSNYISNLDELLANKEIFFVATHPYTEDMQVEPKSLYGFMLPVFTEFLVDSTAQGEYRGVIIKNPDALFAFDDLEDEVIVSNLNSFAPSALTAHKITTIFSRMALFDDDNDDADDDSSDIDAEVLLALLPLAYAQMKLEKLKDTIEDAFHPLPISSMLKEDLHFILGD